MQFAQDTPISAQIARQWKLPTKAQEAALREIANSKLWRLLVLNQSSERADVEVGDSALV